MKAVILVGGEGTRLRPLTNTIVKAMVPVLNKPFIEHVLSYLRNYGITEVILAMGYKPYSIKSYFEKSPMNIKMIYSMEHLPLGTAGAVKHAKCYLDSTFFVFNGDIFCDIDLTGMLRFHQARKAVASIALIPVDDPTQFGVVESDRSQRVKRFIEKPRRDEAQSNMINAGIYILEPQVLDRIPNNERCMFEHDVFPGLLRDGLPFFGYAADNAYWIDAGTPQKYMQLNRDLLLNVNSRTKSGQSKIDVGKNSRISHESQITPPVLVGDNCTIGKRAKLVGPTILGSGCSIGESAIIENSILWKNVEIGKAAIVKNSIIADDNIIKDDIFGGSGHRKQNTRMIL